jgi:hypothetical protein
VLVVYCSAVRRHSIAILLAWVCGQGSKDDAHLQIARVCREQVDRRQEGAEVSLGQLRLNNAPHATQRGARRRDGELMECRKKAGANCYAHLETRKAPPSKGHCAVIWGRRGHFHGPTHSSHAQPTTIAPKPLVLLPPPLPFSIRSAALLHTALQSVLGAAVSLLARRVAHLARVGSIKNVATT